jgi:hypothetical protein
MTMRNAQTRKGRASSDDKSQVAAFRKAARELGADDNEERFKEALRTVAKHKPKQITGKAEKKV